MRRLSCPSILVAALCLACGKAKPLVTASPIADAGGMRLGTVLVETPDAAALPPPPDLEIAYLESQLKCPNRATPNACRILKAFGQATRQVGQVPSGDGRWIGMGYRVEHGSEKAEAQMLSMTNVSSNSVGPTDLPIRIAMDPLPDEKSKDGRKVLRLLMRRDSLPSNSRTLTSVKAWRSGNGRIGMATTGLSVRLLAEEATFVRQANGNMVVIRQRTPPPGASPPGADGLYAELWPVTW
jgi:hypothetical protein